MKKCHPWLVPYFQQNNNKLSVYEYTRLCLQHPEHGYYIKNNAISEDFITAPEISQIFGMCLALWLKNAVGGSDSVNIIELGAGRGTLMYDVIHTLKQLKVVDIMGYIVDSNHTLKLIQQQKLANFRLHWYQDIAELPKGILTLDNTVLIANEFFDALPVHQYYCDHGVYQREQIYDHDFRANKLTERQIVLNNNNYLSYDDHDVKNNVIVEYSPHTQTIIKHLCDLGLSNIIIIDYGYYHEQLLGFDSLQAVSAHKYSDVLQGQGDSDITHHINFYDLAYVMRGYNNISVSYCTQRQFLKQHMADIFLHKLLQKCTSIQEKQQIISGHERIIGEMGDLFKVLHSHKLTN